MEHLGVLRLECGVQHYAWGDTEFIPSLLGIGNDDNKPFAELWMGAHPDLPSKVHLSGDWVPLNELIENATEQVLGSSVVREFGGQLPFLLKVLSAAKPLSIQVHPSKERAREGYARENAAGIPLSAKERNYKDENHKPELLAALTDFYGLRGFRPVEEIAAALRDVPELGRLAKDFEPSSEALKSLYGTFMTLPQEEVDSVLDPLVRRLVEADKKAPFSRADREYWILRADGEFSRGGHRDRGLFSFYLLNLIHLRPGDAMFLPAGVLHAYLEGSGMEIMASSNNVLRGGLTPKHVDVPELLCNVAFEGGPAEILRGVPTPDKREYVYSTSAREFELRRIELEADQRRSTGSDHNVEIVVLIHSTRGKKVEVELDSQSFELSTGRACLVPHGMAYTIHTAGRATLFEATVPPVTRTGQLRQRRAL
jgi:mannose-6-phosphate isomerase class I